jgi:hypothetical protein
MVIDLALRKAPNCVVTGNQIMRCFVTIHPRVSVACRIGFGFITGQYAGKETEETQSKRSQEGDLIEVIHCCNLSVNRLLTR